MTQQLQTTCSLTLLHFQTSTNEITQILWVVLRQCYWLRIQELLLHFNRGFIGVKFMSRCEFIQEQAKTPYITFKAVLGTSNSFRTHVRGGSNKSFGKINSINKLFGYAKISDFNLSFGIEKNVSRFYVSVNHVYRM